MPEFEKQLTSPPLWFTFVTLFKLNFGLEPPNKLTIYHLTTNLVTHKKRHTALKRFRCMLHSVLHVRESCYIIKQQIYKYLTFLVCPLGGAKATPKHQTDGCGRTQERESSAKRTLPFLTRKVHTCALFSIFK